METIEKVEETTGHTTPFGSHIASPVLSVGSTSSNPNFDNSAKTASMASLAPTMGDKLNGKESMDAQRPPPVLQQQLSSDLSHLNPVSTENGVTSQQIPHIHDIHMQGAGSSSIGNGNLLGAHNGQYLRTSSFSGITSTGDGAGQFMSLPRAPSLQDVTSGSHPELLRRSNSNLSDAGVGIPHQLVDGSQPSLLLSQSSGNNSRPVLPSSFVGSTGSGSGNGSESVNAVLGASTSGGTSAGPPYSTMATNGVPPLSQMTMPHSNNQHRSQPQGGSGSGPVLQQQQQQLPQSQPQQVSSQQQQQQYMHNQQYVGNNNSTQPNSSANPSGNYPPGSAPALTNPQKKTSRWTGQQMAPRPWHTSDHAAQRSEMNTRIVSLLQQRRPDATTEWYQKLPQMAKRLEEALYGEAQSFEMYNNYSTLKGRLQQLALSMSGKVGAKGSNGSGAGAGGGGSGAVGADMTQENMQQLQQQQLFKQQQHQHMVQLHNMQQQQQQQHGTNFQQQQMRGYPSAGNPNQPGISSQSNFQPISSGYQQQNGVQPMTIATESSGGLLQGGQMMQSSGMPNMQQNGGAQGAAGTSRFVNMNTLNPSLYNNAAAAVNIPLSKPAVAPVAATKQAAKDAKAKKDAKGKAATKTVAPVNPNAKLAASKQAAAEEAKAKGKKRSASSADDEPAAKMSKTKKPTKKELAEEAKRQSMGQASMDKGYNTALAVAANAKAASLKAAAQSQSGHSEDHRRAVLKQQIQRLLLLRHASKCPHESNRCPVTTHCASMKSLWKHLMKCKDQECKVPHCVSSRYVLSHYSKCQDPHCPVCGPVRASIRKASSDNSEIVQSLNKKPDQMSTGQSHAKPEEPKAPPGPQPPDTLSSVIYNFTDEQIQYHITHLHDGLGMKASDVKTHCIPLVDAIILHANGYIFSSAVDPVKLMIPDYPDIIKRPMDLGTVRKRLEGNYYRDIIECANDVRLTFDNAMLYNPTLSEVHKCARFFKTSFEKSLKIKMDQIEKAADDRRTHPDSCKLCGEKELYFELPNYYCNGKCASRIKRNSVYYSDEKNTLHWCQGCFTDLRDPIKVVGAPNISKKDLKKGKLQGETEELKEPMVCCDGCDRWVHCVCGLFNARRNLSKEMQYFCPSCVLQQRAKLPAKVVVPDKKMLANTLPHCLLSEYIEKRVAIALENAYKESAEKLDIPLSAVEKAPALSIRQVSCIDNNQATQEGMRKRYAHKNYPVEFPCRAKCILMFQHLDGQDVILYGMYVYEYGHKCPQPNQRRVYISYLDSVHYLRPRQYRTPVYHEILIAYLEYVKMRGFHTAHIWACPPMPKDDYIFNIHPPDQKTPKQERLRQWYVSMLDKCIERGIVQEVKDLHTEYMLDEANDATVLPYLDGDYWVGVAEEIIKKLGVDDDAVDEDANVADDSKSKSKRKKMKTAPPKRNRGRQPRGSSTSGAAVTSRDPVMVKLAATIEPMKHDFFVARLHSKEYIAACSRNAEAELDAEADKVEDKEKDEKNLVEEALSSGDSGKTGKMKKMVAQTSEPNYSIGPPPDSEGQSVAPASSTVAGATGGLATAHSLMTSGGSLAASKGGENGENGEFVDPFDRPSEVSSGAAQGTTSSSDVVNQIADTGDKMEVDGDGSLSEGVVKIEGVANVQSSDAPSGEDAQQLVKTEGEGGLMASVSKLASSFFGKNNGSSDVTANASVNANASAQGESEPTSESFSKMEVDVKEHGNGGEEQKASDVSSAEGKTDDIVKMEIDEGGVVIKAEPTSAPDELAVTTNTQVKVEGGDVTCPSAGEGSSSAGTLVKKEEKPPVVSHVPTKDTEDRDDTQECEHFETRLSFLQLCQGNHYQFDQLRRAKHTSMMVLYHLHNPDAPKFMAVCNVPTCNQSIVTGTRFHCDTCDVDFCHSCYLIQKDTKGRHIHPLRPMVVSGSSAVQALTEEQRRERNRSIQLHLQLLLHSARDCIGKKCASKNCEKMKEFLKHEPSCPVGFKKGCPTCKKVLNLLTLHARNCRVDNCPVPKCTEIKEKTRQNQLKQRQMDDRRRQMMNDMYSRAAGT